MNAGGQTVDVENVAAEVGSTVRLRCWINSTSRVHWDNYRRPNPTVYNGYDVIGPLRDRYRVDVTDSRYDLVISDVHLTDAGNYTCYDETRRPNVVLLLVVLRSMCH